mmetsp:Transcript_44009/g.126019  ORF Transcript_44009/g.126019 Transcript_44009/m.126019 type:complete len:264 (-) Transcript_44009:216-1007(-)
MQTRPHVQQTMQVDIVLRLAAPIGQVVKPARELDPSPLELVPLPDVPILEASLLLVRRRGDDHPKGGPRDVEVLGEIEIIHASVAEAVQVNEGPLWRHSPDAYPTRLEDDARLEARLLALGRNHIQIPSLNRAAQTLEGIRARHLVRALCAFRFAKPVDIAILVPGGRRGANGRSLEVLHGRHALRVDVPHALGLPGAEGPRGLAAVGPSGAREASEQSLRIRHRGLAETSRPQPLAQEGSEHLRTKRLPLRETMQTWEQRPH